MDRFKQHANPHRATTPREVADFLILAVSIIFIFRLFVAEPFEVPTASMAPTLLGRHQTGCCPHCGYDITVPFPKPRDGQTEIRCRNCQSLIPLPSAPSTSGDRVLVSKLPPSALRRFDVVVFKGPDEASVPYVKRLIGLPGETVRIREGEIEVREGEADSFHICRKPPKLSVALAQLVHDDRYRSPDVLARWRSSEPTAWRYVDHGYEVASPGCVELAYYHMADDADDAQPISDGEMLIANKTGPARTSSANRVDDLFLDFVAKPSADCREISVTLRSKRGLAEFRWDIVQKKLTLTENESILWEGSFSSPRKPPRFRFADVDEALWLWVDGRLLASAPYDQELFAVGLDHQSHSPVALCADGVGTRLTDLVLLRDIYYRRSSRAIDPAGEGLHVSRDPLITGGCADGEIKAEWTLGPGEYFVLGDNSADSNDSRHWQHGHALPERLILGRVVWNIGSTRFDRFGPMEPR